MKFEKILNILANSDENIQKSAEQEGIIGKNIEEIREKCVIAIKHIIREQLNNKLLVMYQLAQDDTYEEKDFSLALDDADYCYHLDSQKLASLREMNEFEPNKVYEFIEELIYSDFE